ncbi:zinc-finger of the MIZ type in Nse subunit-domain-containing protein [Cladorrhinum samala]|uniref:peptidylprolyl isomerase n=1 Tax=Cladorrhinum samala TaxID=585594 RepID=A0AAV9HSK1_9PEZI|nr:zinc-finger of the MIZ type in Nse subunit-domain-containing protein [Cladorrhinum samala]
MPRLLQSAARGSAAAATAPAPELPPYEPPEYPMDEKNRNILKNMADSRESNDASKRKYEDHLNRATQGLRTAVGSINDVLHQRRQAVAKMAQKRREQGGQERSQEEREMEEYLVELTAEVSELTGKSEDALRKILDCRAEFQDNQEVLKQVLAEAQKQRARPEPKPKKEKRQARPNGSDDEADGDSADVDDQDEEMEDAEDIPPVTGVLEMLKAARRSKFESYRAMTPYQRYALNNDYISFKRTWHDALHPDGDAPLPDASDWFDEQGNPIMTVVNADNDDDDLVVEREIMDLKCPLSLQVYKEPFSNHRCKHTFEKSAIVEFINSNRGVAKCPVCSEELRLTDFYLDDVVLRKVKRAEQAAKQDATATSDIEADDSDSGDLVIGRSRNIKKERHPSNLASQNSMDEDED